jgi:septal ring factor EnvC (AmiA/AmiB activator)
MGFMDKVKAAAQDVTQQAKTATSSAQSKMEESKLRKQADEAAKKLGYEIYAERTSGTPAANADALVTEIQGLEGQITSMRQQAEAAAAAPEAEAPAEQAAPAPAQSPEATPTSPPPSTSSSEPTSGDFKL